MAVKCGWFWFWCFVSSLQLRLADSKLNLFLNQREVRRLLGTLFSLR